MRIESVLEHVRATPVLSPVGRITATQGPLLIATGLDAKLGDGAWLLGDRGQRLCLAEVVGFRDEHVMLSPFGELDGISPESRVELTGGPVNGPIGPGLLGRVVNALGEPLDSGSPLTNVRRLSLGAPPRSTQEHLPIETHLETGVRAIDAFVPVGEGQRMGIFAGSGVGKTTLLTMLAEGTTSTVTVLVLVGERGREVHDLLDATEGSRGHTVVIVTNSDEPPIRRLQAMRYGARIAESFRERGESVLLLVDSLTRVAFAQREIGLAAGEPPATRGYPPSVFGLLPRITERAGRNSVGSITAIFTILVEGDDLDDPVADHARALLDGHIVLDRKLAERAHFPAINVLASNSRVATRVTTSAEQEATVAIRRAMGRYAEVEDLVRIGAYRKGNDAETDVAIAIQPAIEGFLQQRSDEPSSLAQTRAALAALLRSGKGRP